MPGMREVEWEPCLLERHPCPELEQRFRRETGRPGTLMQYFEGCPWLADALVRLSVQINTHVHLDSELADLIGLVVSQDNSCRFCFGMQRAFLRVIGISEARITRLEQDHLTGDFTPREAAVLDIARRISRSRPPVTAADLETLRQLGLGRDEVLEIASTTAVHLFFNRASTLAALPPDAVERFPDRWWVRVLRPLLSRRFHRMRFAPGPSFLSPAEREGVCAPIVNALDGLPLARELRHIIDRLWQSKDFPPRTTTLLFAVVARALGSMRCEAEARVLLGDLDMPASEIDHVLDHLAGPGLSALESRLIPFARETVWYQPAQIQRRSAELRAAIGNTAFLQFLGITAFFNALCRIAFVTDIESW